VESLEAAVLPVKKRFPAMMGAGLLVLALSCSACSLASSPSGKSLPISVDPGSTAGVHASQCTLSSSGTRVIAYGTFNPAAKLPYDAQGQQVGANELQLRLVSSKKLQVGNMVVRHAEVGATVAGVSVGQTSWRLATNVQPLDGFGPVRCVVTFEYLGPGALP
jgi:hypothetical protein